MLSQRKSPRYQWYDYTSTGSYFITICTKNREEYFGNIKDGKMIINEIGKIVETYRYEIPNHFEYVELGEFVVMPNHIHGIVIIKPDYNQTDRRDAITARPINQIKTMCPNNQTDPNNQFVANKINKNDMGWYSGQDDVIVPTTNLIYNDKKIKLSVNRRRDNAMRCPNNKNNPSLSTIIGSYKSICSKMIHYNNKSFERQPRFHDHIIRNEIELQNIQQYIYANPTNRKKDLFYI